MNRILEKKKVVFVLLAATALLMVGYLFFQGGAPDSAPQGFSPQALQEDESPPTVIIESPEEGTWIGRDFQAFVFEEDLETEIARDSCVVQVCAYGANNEEQCTGVMQRACGEKTPVVTVGPESMCSFEGRDACFVYVDAQDLAENKGGSYRSWHIDFTPPSVGKVSVQEKQEGYAIQAEAHDNTALRLCGLYANERFVAPLELQEGCREACGVSGTFEPTETESRLFIRCDDIAGNSSDGEEFVVRLNQAPSIASCRVQPTQGTPETMFQFSLEATDPNQDPLSYSWEPGDGTILKNKDATHQYTAKGNYMPKVIVRDAEGLSAECNTAWVVVE